MTMQPLMTSFPRKGARVRDSLLTPFEDDRTPVYVDSKGTATLAVPSGDIVLALRGGSGGLALPTSLFHGNGALRFGIRQKYMTALRVRVHCTFQLSAGVLDSRVARQLEQVLERLEVRITEDMSEELAMPALPIRVFSQGVMFAEGHQPFCDTDEFKVTLAEPTSGLPVIKCLTACAVSAELYLEAVFQ